jgi:nitrite reductase (NO-forming)
VADVAAPGSGRSEESRASARDGWVLVTTVVAVMALLGTIVAAGFAWRANDEVRAAASGGSGSAGVVGAPETVEVEIGEFYVKPASIDVPAGTEVIVKVTNKGTMPHDLKLDGQTGIDMIDPGATAEATLGAVTESTEAWCTVPGHKQAGMVMKINVSGEAAISTHGGGSSTAASGASIDFNAEPGDGWKPYDPALAPVPGGREHKLTLHATEKVMEVAPGVTQQLWTFNDQVPGPTLRGKVGDLFTVTLVNDGKLGHSIDFHASKVASNDEMRTIQPGESLAYQFVAKHAGGFMYHCGTAPTLHHIGNGMYGAIIIDPPDLPAVDHEYVLVQSELYLGANGQPGDLDKMRNEQADAVVFNGYVNQYQHAPIRVEPNQRVRVWVVDAGPSENSAFHIVGTIFDTVFKEGTYLLRPDSRQGGSQVLDLQPAQGGFVEFTLDEAGLYPIVTHKFANVGKGALGLFQAGDVAVTGGGH